MLSVVGKSLMLQCSTILSFLNKLPWQWDFLSLTIHVTRATWNLSSLWWCFHNHSVLFINPVPQETGDLQWRYHIYQKDEVFDEKDERKQHKIGHRPILWLGSWCLCHLVLCVRREPPSWYGHICCRCDAWRCAAGHSSSATPTQTTSMLRALGRNEAFPNGAEPGPSDTCGMSSASVHRLHVLGPWYERLKHWLLMAMVVCQSVYEKVGGVPHNSFADPHRQVWDCFGKRPSVAGCWWTLCPFLASGSQRGGASGWQSCGEGEGHFNCVAKIAAVSLVGGWCETRIEQTSPHLLVCPGRSWGRVLQRATGACPAPEGVQTISGCLSWPW